MLRREFYARDAVTVAKELLGKVLVHNTPEGIVKGIIVETEAYYGEFDSGSHAYGGKRTPRNETMWGPPGYAYVYFTYGMHYMLNVVTGKDGEASAVLIRAVEPLEGIELMRKRREKAVITTHTGRMAGVDLSNLTNGPAKVTQAFEINKHHNGIDMVNSNLRIEQGRNAKFNIVSAPRIGIKNDTGENLRFYIAGNKFVSTSSMRSPVKHSSSNWTSR